MVLQTSHKFYFEMRWSSYLWFLSCFHSVGFEVSDKGCCGSGKLEVAVLCNPLSPHTCEDVSKYVFWDSYHPTENAYKIITDTVVKGYLHFLLWAAEWPCYLDSKSNYCYNVITMLLLHDCSVFLGLIIVIYCSNWL